MRRVADLQAARYEKSGGVPEPGVRRVYMPKHIALRYLDAGDYDRSIDWLERTFEVHDPNLPYVGCSLSGTLCARTRASRTFCAG